MDNVVTLRQNLMEAQLDAFVFISIVPVLEQYRSIVIKDANGN